MPIDRRKDNISILWNVDFYLDDSSFYGNKALSDEQLAYSVHLGTTFPLTFPNWENAGRIL